MTATGSSLIGLHKQSCARERSIYVCGELLNLQKSVIRHTQGENLSSCPKSAVGTSELRKRSSSFLPSASSSLQKASSGPQQSARHVAWTQRTYQ